MEMWLHKKITPLYFVYVAIVAFISMHIKLYFLSISVSLISYNMKYSLQSD